MQKNLRKWLLMAALLLAPWVTMAQVTLPYSTNFEGLTTGQLPSGWIQLATGSSGAGNFPACYVWAPNARNSSVYFEFESTTGQTEIAALPQMSDINQLQFSFYASLMNANFVFEVGVVEDDSVFVPVDTVALTPGSGGNWAGSYHYYTVYFNNYYGYGDRIGMRVTSSGSYTLMLEDFLVEYIPTCPAPVSPAVDSMGDSWVAFSWREVGSAYSWEIAYDVAPFTPDENTPTITTYDSNYVLTSLSPANTYDVYVRSDCGGDYSSWVHVGTVQPGTYIMNQTVDTLRTCAVNIYDNGGPNGDYALSSDNTLVIMSSNPDSTLRLWGSMNIENGYDFMTIYDGYGSNATQLYYGSGNTNIGPFIANSGAFTIHFTSDNVIVYSGFELHATCTYLPSCTAPVSISADSVRGDTVWVSWVDTAWNTSFDLAYGPTGFNPDTAMTNVVTGINDTAYMLTGLTMGANYDIYVRADCGSEGSFWIGPVAVIPGYLYIMPVNGTDTLHACGYTIYDNGGPDGQYSANCDGTLVLYPDSPNSTFVLSGTLNTESCCDHLYIYDGVGTSGALLYQGEGTTSFSNIRSEVGVVTIYFHSDGSIQNNGFSVSAVCEPLPDCIAPINFATTTIGTTTADLVWTERGTATSWVVEYDTVDFTPGTNTAANSITVYDTVATLTGLDSGTLYYVYMASDCGIETSIYRDLTFTTLAASATTLPFACDFEGEGSNGWDLINGSQTNQWVVDSMVNHGGSKSLHINWANMYAYDNSASYVFATRTLDLTDTGMYAYSFDWLCNGESTYDFMRVALVPVSTDIHAGDYCGFDPYSSMPAGSIALDGGGRLNLQSSWQTRVGEFHLSTPGTYKWVFMWRNDGSVSNQPPAAVDNVMLSLNACSMVDNLTAAPTSDSIYVSWTPTGTEYEWMVCCDSVCVTTTTTSYAFGGLTANTLYTISVRPLCGSDTGMAVYTTVRTNCLSIDSLPYIETFESSAVGGSSSAVFVNCWTRLTDATQYIYPYVSSYTDYNHTPGGNKGLYWYRSSSTGDYGNYQCLVLPPVNETLHPLNTLQLTFWARNSYSDYYSWFIVGAMGSSSDITTFQPIDTVHIMGDAWALYEVPFNSYTGTANQMAIMSVNNNDYWYAYVDDFTIEAVPSCVRPNNLVSTGSTASSVSLDWTERGTATEWELAIETSSTTTPTGDTLLMADSVTVTGLVGGTTYYFYVRSICGVGDTSQWSEECVSVPGTWNMRANQTDTLHSCGGVIYDDGGATGQYSGNQDSYIIIMPDAPNNLVSVSGTSYTESSFDYIRIYDGIGTSGTELWNDYGVSSNQTFGPLVSTSGPITVYFHSDGSIYYDGFAINVSCISAYCRVTNIQLDPSVNESASQLALTWDTNGALYYEVEYGPAGFAQGSGTTMTTYTNSVIIPGLTALTNYDVYVRSICSSTDTGSWTMGTFQTTLCDNAQITAVGSENSTGTSYYAPVNNYYNYTLSETIIDSAEFDGPMDIQYITYYYNYSSPSTDKNNCTIYFQPTTLSTFGSSSDVVPLDTTTAVKVYTGPLNCTQGWNYFTLDTMYHYDGMTNLLVIVDDNSGDYNTSSYVFKTEPCTGNKVLYYYSDTQNPDPMTISSSYSGTRAVASWRPVMQLLSCGAAGCRQPVITSTSQTYESATVTWSGTGSAYEVNIKETTASDFTNADIPVVGTSYTFYGLQPATSYTVRVRQDCNADSLGYSSWALSTIVTDSMPCLPPDSLTVTDITNATATFDWMPFGFETMWEVHVWNTAGFDSTYTVSSHPVILGGYTAGVSYNASVRPLCGSAHNIQGDWGDTVTFTAATCPDVTGLAAGNVQPTSLTLSWNNNPAADTWVIEYGYTGFEQGSGTQAIATTTTYVVNGLLEETGYDFYVRAMCGTDWYSENWAYVSATTPYGGVICDAPTGVSAVVAGNAVTVSWTAGEGNISYELEYGPHGFTHGTGTTQTAATSPIMISNLNYETQYDVYVRAFCEQNASSAWSVVTSFTTEAQGSEDCDPVLDLTITEITQNSALVNWVAGATGSEWEVVLTNASGATLSEARTNEQHYQLNGLTPGTSYIVKVRTVCGDDQYSSFVSTNFTTIAVGIDGVAEASCTIYPNPTSSTTTISVNGVSGKVKIAVVDMNGRTVASELLECSSDCTKTMDVDRLAQGAYFVRITGENVNMVKKLIVR